VAFVKFRQGRLSKIQIVILQPTGISHFSFQVKRSKKRFFRLRSQDDSQRLIY